MRRNSCPGLPGAGLVPELGRRPGVTRVLIARATSGHCPESIATVRLKHGRRLRGDRGTVSQKFDLVDGPCESPLPIFRISEMLSIIIFFFFSLFHQRADDEALTRFLQTSLFLVASPILVKSMFLSFRSSLTLSIQVFLCLPLLSS